jgi:hypothetical protein
MPEYAGSLRVFFHLNVNRAAPSSSRKGRGKGCITRCGSCLYRGRGDARGDRVLDRDRDRSTVGAAGGVAGASAVHLRAGSYLDGRGDWDMAVHAPCRGEGVINTLENDCWLDAENCPDTDTVGRASDAIAASDQIDPVTAGLLHDPQCMRADEKARDSVCRGGKNLLPTGIGVS